MAFKYRDAGVYQVARGQVWAVGNHHFGCFDVVEDYAQVDAYVQQMAGGEVTLLYADPPWSDGQQNQFRTLNDLPPTPYPWPEIFKSVLALVPYHVPRWIVGDRYSQEAVAELADTRQRWALPAFSTPRVIGILHYAGYTPPPPGPSYEGVKDQKLPERIMERYPQGVVLDPCAGLGITSRCAERLGWQSVSSELSPHRVSVALRKMEKLTGETPVRVA